MGKKSKNGKKEMTFVKWVILTCFMTIISTGVLLSLVSGMFISKITSDDYIRVVENISMHVASMLDQLDEGDYTYNADTNQLYKGDVLITDNAFWTIQGINADVHHTIFWGDTRILSDIKDTEGNSVVGKPLNDETISNAVKNEGIYSENGVNIYGTKYSVCYYPLKNGDTVVGMVFTGVNQEQVTSQIITSLLILIAIAFVIALILILIIVRAINKRAKKFGVNLTEASSIALDKRDTVTELGGNTKENMQQINQAIDQVAMAVTQQAGHTEEILLAMEDFADRIDAIMGNVNKTSDVADNSLVLMEQLKDRVYKLEEVSSSNSNDIVNISKQIEEDNNAVEDISKILDVINDIAFQITILSFNASVEAARAGEVGKGFAVVADSIKELSDKTKESLVDITNIVEDITEKMGATTKASSKLITENNKVVEALAETKTQLNDVTKAFDNISENLSAIMSESEAINTSKAQVMENVSSLAAASEENAAMGEEMKATSDEVITATDHLMGEIDKLSEVTSIVDNVKTLFADKI